MDTNHSPSNKRQRKILDTLIKRVGIKESRMVQKRNTPNQTAWFWLGMFGIVGWSIAIPTLLGIALGVWIDTTWPSRFSWTLMLLAGGVILGCLNAWFWITREGRHE
jgi:ATP synthase protein I